MANSEMSEFSYSMQVTSKRMLNGELYGISPTNTQDPRKALAADRNPYSNSVTGKNPASGEPLYSAGAGRYEYNPSAVISGFPTAPSFTAANYNTLLRQRPANSRNHNLDGQNVLRLDGSAKWQTNSKCGADDDCIWTTLEDSGAGPRADKVPANGAGYGDMRSRSNWLTDSLLLP